MRIKLIGGPDLLDGEEREIEEGQIEDGIFSVEYMNVPPLTVFKPGTIRPATKLKALAARYKINANKSATADFVEPDSLR